MNLFVIVFLIILSPSLIYSQINISSSYNFIDNNSIVETVGNSIDVWFEVSQNPLSIHYENPICGDFLVYSDRLIDKSIKSTILTLNSIKIEDKVLEFNSNGYAYFKKLNHPPGVYIIQTKIDGTTYSDKLIIKCSE